MTRAMKTLLTVAALANLTACDYIERRDLLRERTSKIYQDAMTDYNAGRIDQAIAGFRKTCKADPGNASARFQLACLLQESRRDHFGALCAYNEFLSQHPESDKAHVARDRAAYCEREAAKELAEKHGLTSNTALAREIDDLRKKLKDAEKRNTKLNDDVAVAMQRVSRLLEENEKLKAAIKGDAAPGEGLVTTGIKDAKALLDEDEGDRMHASAEALKVKRESDLEDTDRIKLSADVAALRRESDEDANLSGSSLLPAHPAGMAPQPLRRETPKPVVQEPPHEKRPAEYEVQDGDTLYRIAMRFYGRASAWKIIRNANKAVISTDGRVNKGMRIKLPDPE